MKRDTSILAHKELKSSGRISNQIGRIVNFIKTGGRENYSLQEIAKHTRDIVGSISMRCAELKKLKVLEECVQRKCSISGRTINALRFTARYKRLIAK